MIVSIYSLRIGIADGVLSIRTVPTERVRLLTERVVLCLSKELQQRSVPVLSVALTSNVVNLYGSNGNHTSIYTSWVVMGTLIRA